MKSPEISIERIVLLTLIVGVAGLAWVLAGRVLDFDTPGFVLWLMVPLPALLVALLVLAVALVLWRKFRGR